MPSAASNVNNQATQNLIFGVFATVLAFGAFFVGFLQLRKRREMADEERIGWEQRSDKVIVIRYAFFVAEAFSLPRFILMRRTALSH